MTGERAGMTRRCTRLAIFATHPIQYHAPWFRALASSGSLEVTVYFAHVPDHVEQGAGFGVPLQWDVPLLAGYESRTLSGARWLRRAPPFLRHPYVGLGQALRRHRPDAALVLGWNEISLLQALLCCKALRIPVLMRGESNALRQRPWAVRIVHRALFRLCDGFLAIGEANRQLYIRSVGDAARLVVAGYSVDNERFFEQSQQLSSERAALRSRWGIPEASTCFCFAGKLQPKKRPLDFLEALRQARDRGSAVHALVVGDGEQMIQARDFVRAHGLPVTFTGFLNQTQIAAAYVAADALVLPSDFGETWGLVVNEAMACGRPALVSDRVGCGSDLVIGGQTGAVFPFENTGALCALMIEWASAPARVREMGRLAQRRVREEFSIARATAQTIAAVSSLLDASVA